MHIRGKHLDYNNRLMIETLLNKNIPVSKIAELLDCHRSTLYKEIKHGLYTALTSEFETIQRYSADIAQQYHDFHATAKGAPLKIGCNIALSNYIEHKIINEKYSPAAALHEYKNQHGYLPFSVNTLYSYIDKGIFLNLSRVHLPEFPYRKRSIKRIKKGKRPSVGPSIDTRPDISDRLDFGHWEGDTIKGKRDGKGQYMFVLTERKTRFEIVQKLPDGCSSSVVAALDVIFELYDSRIFKSITFDNGSEFFDYLRMINGPDGLQRTQIYYCHPYRSSERGTNERTNRILRRWFPKSSDFNQFSVADVERVNHWINNYPRRILNYLTPAALFYQELQLLTS